ncbi:uncharacterized protein LOC143574750 [Bidens hawaiensis]|uniref:uncharacterized protein LOC143574750 n=1 Tax=Bidens hawaiensis TaxID=980011 RepID=UPI00404B1E3D
MAANVNTRQEVDKTLKEHERMILRMETNSQAAMADLQSNMEKMMERMLAPIQEQLRNQHNQHPTTGGAASSSSGSQYGVDQRLSRYGRIDFPKFNGEDVEGWLYKCDHFFEMDRTPDSSKLRIAVVNLEGPALQWHQAYMRSCGRTVDTLPWESYVGAITTRFSESLLEDAMEELKVLYQTGSLKKYCLAFDALLNKVVICEEYAVSLFVGARYCSPYPAKKTTFNYFNPTPINTYNPKIAGPTNATKLPLLPTHTQKPFTSRRLTTKELEAKRAKGECFWCSEKFSAGHKCPNRQLFVIELADDDSDEAFVQEVVEEVEEPRISIHALTGITSYSTMKIIGSMGTRTLHILVDSGSTHNFIDQNLATKLKITTQEVKSMKVTVANGNQLTCQNMCKDFKWMMQGTWFSADVLEIPLESYDIVLGIQWLTPLGDITWNFGKMTMEFQVEGVPYKLKGIETNKISLCYVEKMSNMLQSPTKIIPSQLYGLQLIPPTCTEGFGSKVGNTIEDKALQDLKDMQQHLIHLQTVLEILRNNQLYAKQSKCTFSGQSVEYLGHIITKEGVSTDPSKIDAVKDGFRWSMDAQDSFKQLKGALSSAPVLALPDLNQPFVVETDASNKGIGVVLMQEKHPLAFISRALSPKQQTLSVYEK